MEIVGPLLLLVLIFSPLIWLLATDKKRTQKRKEQERREQLEYEKVTPLQHCMTCGSEFKPLKSAQGAIRGNTIIEVVLWLTFIIPVALVYSIWRRMGIGKAKLSCPECSSNTIVPASSPAARAHLKSISS